MESLLRDDEGAEWTGKGSTHWGIRIQSYLFDVLYSTFLYQEKPASGSFLSVPIVVLENALSLAHILSLIEWSDARLQTINWVLGMTRVDVLARYLGLASQLAFGHLVISGIPLIGLALSRVEAIPRKWARVAVVLPIIYTVKLAFVPILALHGRLLICLLGTCGRENNAEGLEVDDMIWEQLLSFPVLTLTLIYAYSYHSLLYRISGFRRIKHDYQGLSHSSAVKSQFLATTLAVAFQFITTNQLFSALLSAFIFCKSLYDLVTYLPYFAMWVNAMKAGMLAAVCWVYSVKAFTEIAGEAVSAFFLVSIVTWLVSILAYKHVFIRFHSYKTHSNSNFPYIYDLDFATRYHLASGYQPEVIKSMYKSAYRTLESELIVLWEASILLGFSKDPVDASLLLALNPSLRGSSLEFAFQRFILLKDTESHTNRDRDHLEFLMTIEDVRKSDEVLCLLLVQFCNSFLGSGLSVAKFERLVLRIVDEKNKVSMKYKNLIAKYKGERRVSALYGTLMVEILGDLAGQVLLLQSESTNKQENGVICLHASYAYMGEIAIFNSAIQDLLKSDARDLKSQSCRSLFPQLLQPLAIPTLKTALSTSDLTEITLLFSFIANAEGYLMNLKVTCKMVAWKEVPIFFLSFKQGEEMEMLLIDSEGVIVGQSEGVCRAQLCEMRIYYIYEDYRLGETGQMLVFDKLNREKTIITASALTLQGKLFYRIHRFNSISAGNSINLSVPKGVHFISTSLDVSTSHASAFLPDQSLKQQVQHSMGRSKVAVSTSSSVTSADFANRVLNQKIRLAAKRSHLFALVAYTIVIAMVLAVMLTIGHVVDQLLNQDSIRAIGRQRYLSIETATAVRAISLIQSGFLNQSEDIYRAMILSDLNYFYAAMNETSSKLPIWPSGPYKSMHFAPVIPQWIYYDGQPQVSMQGILPVMTLMLRTTLAVNNSEYINFTNPNVQYIFRNGPAENSVYQNRSIFLFLEDQHKTRISDLALTDSLIIAAAVLLVALQFVLVVPQTIATEQLNRQIWKRLYDVPIEDIIELRLKVAERLEGIHGLEGPIENIVRKQKQPNPRPVWLYYAAQTLILLVVSGLFFGPLFSGPYKDIQDKLMTLPHFLNWGQLFHLYFEGSCFWNSELYLQQYQNISHTTILNNTEYWRFPELRLSKYQSDFVFSNSLLNSPHSKYCILTTNLAENYTKFQLNQSCDQVSLSNCNNTALYLGQVFAANEFMQQMRDMTAAILRGKAKRTEVYACESRRKVATAGRRFLNTILEAEMKESVKTDFAQVRTGVILYCMCLILIYFTVNWTVVLFLNARMKRVTEMVRVVSKK